MHPEEALVEVNNRLQRAVMRGGQPERGPLKGKVAVRHSTA
jgi:hypothetical protein